MSMPTDTQITINILDKLKRDWWCCWMKNIIANIFGHLHYQQNKWAPSKEP